MNNTMIKIRSFQAGDGDSFFIKIYDSNDYKNTVVNILIDGGRKIKCSKEIIKELSDLKKMNEKLNLLVITHLDNDHIEGILDVYESEEVDKKIIDSVWFNSKKVIVNNLKLNLDVSKPYLTIKDKSKKKGYKEGTSLEILLERDGLINTDLIVCGNEYVMNETTKIKILSPTEETLKKLAIKWDEYFNKHNKTEKYKAGQSDYKLSVEELLKSKFKEDTSLANSSSIVMLIEASEKKILMTADALPSQIVKGLRNLGYNEENKIKLDLFKIPHHGSKKNSNFELLNMIECKKYLISTNGSRRPHPNKEALIKYISKENNSEFIFNYSSIVKENIFTKDEIIDYNIKMTPMNDEPDNHWIKL